MECLLIVVIAILAGIYVSIHDRSDWDGEET